MADVGLGEIIESPPAGSVAGMLMFAEAEPDEDDRDDAEACRFTAGGGVGEALAGCAT
jgi:hypothetical protein